MTLSDGCKVFVSLAGVLLVDRVLSSEMQDVLSSRGFEPEDSNESSRWDLRPC